jgi:chemotaxis protein methyltransferase CheR
LADKAVTTGITHVYLGLQDFPDSVYPQKLIEELRDRVEKNPVDLVISVLPGADRFLLSYGQELFPGVPMVFAIPSTRDVQKINKLKNAVIIPSVAGKALQTTVERIFSLLPDTKHLVVVSGNAPVDRNYLEMAKRAIASSKRVTKVSYLVGLPLDELWKHVSSLATDTAILFTIYDEDKNGKQQETMDVGVRLSIRANAPVFSFNESLLGNGIIGGNVTSAESYGKETAEAALRLLKGEQPTAISPIELIPVDVYDWRALKRWNISEDRLPSGSQVRYKTVTLWETYKVHIIVGIGVICLETILIYALFISLMRSKRIKEALQALQESEERYRTLQENVPVGVYRTSNSGKFMSLNPAAFKMFGLDAEEDLSSYQVSDFYNDPEKRRDVLSQLKTERKITDFEVEFRRKDGSLFWVSLNATQVTDKDGNFIFIDGVVQDITERKRAEEGLRQSYSEIEQLKNQLEAESAYLQDEIKLEHNFENIIGQSEALKYVLHRLEQVAPTNSAVLIMGETGTGKELIARALHRLSPHGKRALVKVNCAALPGELIESELFGREKGAFTGATTTQLGRFELAKGSTLFLDEIGELSIELQAKLLRVLESGEFERLGSSATLHSDARIIAATNRVLEEEVRKGRFREDLWYRLKVFPITVPPLRERKEDIPLLVKWFVDQLVRKMGKRTAEIPKHTMQALQNYPWPGNVRELEHAIE